MTFFEAIDMKAKYQEVFGSECDPIKYTMEDEPDITFTGLIAQCCIESGKPYEDMNIADINSWLVQRGYRAIGLDHWNKQLPKQ